jgi:hypothetical protein
MKSIVTIVASLALGFAGGYLVRAKTADRPTPRAEREEVDLPRKRQELIASLTPEERAAIVRRDHPEVFAEIERRRSDATAGAPGELPAEEPAAAEDAKAKGDEIEQWLRSASTQWKAFAGMQAKNKVRGLLAGLGFDPETAKQIEAAIVADVERQVDEAIAMMLGEAEMNEGAFTSMMGIPPDLSTALERELGTYLSDEEIAAVRERVQGAHEKQMTDLADMQIASMGIRNLSSDQQTRLRDVFVGKDMMSQQMTQFAEITRNRERFLEIMQDEEAFTTMVKKNLEPQKRRVRDILDDEQFKRYEAYEQNMLQQARMGMKMMSAMMKKPTEEK